MQNKNIKCIEDFTKEELGVSIGREEVKILAVSDENIAKNSMPFMKRKIKI